MLKPTALVTSAVLLAASCALQPATAGEKRQGAISSQALEAKKQMKTVCNSDMERLCPSGDKRARKTCLRAKRAELSPQCTAARANMKAVRKRAG